MTLHLNPSYKVHILVAFLISVWLVGFLILIAPFDVSELDLRRRLFLMPPYGLITFLGYMVLIPIQNKLYYKSHQWTLLYEVLFLIAYNIIVCVACLSYYQTDNIRGNYSLPEFILGIYTPIFFVLLSILIILRWFLFKQTAKTESNKITIFGDNKLDTLRIREEDLVAVSSADNYVEISYLKNDELAKKLIRTTLKKISTELPNLVQTHRSHLINPSHFSEWKDSKTIVVGQLNIPVTKTYKETILSLQTRP
jgi:uncharacterized membrane protein YhdT